MKYNIMSVFIMLMVYYNTSFSQGGEYIDCHILSGGGSSLSVEGESSCFDYDTDYEDAPIITIYVNVHIFNTLPSVSTATLVERARDFIRFSNETFANMQQNWRNGPNGVPAPHVPDAKIRVKLYSESSNSSDVHGGIWVYPTQMYDITNPSEDHPADLIGDVPYTNRYGTNVLDVILVNYGLFSANGQNNFVANAGVVARLGILNNENYVYMTDVNAAAERDIIENNGTNNWLRAISRSFNHEIGHVLSLRHSEDCNNPCDGIDIDVQEECGPNCPQVAVCDGFNPGIVNCNGTIVSRCTWANSRNITSQGWWNDAITPCQWEQIFDHALNNPRDFYQLCTTNTTLNLTTSPLDDYRASQSITSTSVITGSRKVDYFSPTIRLNNGFRVAQGTEFWAYPAIFACCSSGSLQLLAKDIEQQSTFKLNLPEKMEIYPNPFNDELHLNFQFLGINDTDETFSVMIFDNRGKRVYSGNISAIDNVKLNTSNWENGLYYVFIQSPIKNISKKIIRVE